MVAHFDFVLFLYSWYDHSAVGTGDEKDREDKHMPRWLRFCKVALCYLWWDLAMLFGAGLKSCCGVFERRKLESYTCADKDENDTRLSLSFAKESRRVFDNRSQFTGEEGQSHLDVEEEISTRTKAKMTKDKLLAKDMHRRLTAAMFVTSSASDADVALDWVFAAELLGRSAKTASDSVLPIPDRFSVLAVVFSAIGTVLWVLSSFDLCGFAGPAAPFGYDNPKNHPFWFLPWTRAMVVFVTVVLEDIPQLVISIVVQRNYDASTLTSFALANIVTSAYAFALKLVQTFVEQGSHELDIPTTINMANSLEQNGLLAEFESLLETRDNVEHEIDAAVSKCYRGMQELDFSYEKFDDYRIKKLAEDIATNKTLTTIDLQGSSIGDDGATVLAKALETNSTLLTLDLSCNTIGHVGANALSKLLEANSTLRSLHLSGNSIGHDGAIALSKALETNLTLQNLDLSRNSVGHIGATALAKVLETKSMLQQLALHWNYIGDDGSVALAKALETNSTLHTLDLFGNFIGDVGVTAFAKTMQKNSTLQLLILSGNSIGHVGATALAKALEANSTVQSLVLSGNSIGDVGATSLARALDMNSTLETLDLSRNYIGDIGATAFAEALERNNNVTLKYLDLSENTIADVGANALAKALETNSMFESLIIYWNSIDKEVNRAISADNRIWVQEHIILERAGVS